MMGLAMKPVYLERVTTTHADVSLMSQYHHVRIYVHKSCFMRTTLDCHYCLTSRKQEALVGSKDV